MKFTLYDNLQTFYSDVYEILMADEAQNMLILGNLIIGYEGADALGWRDSANWIMATVAENNDIRLVALMTPPFGLTMYATGGTVDLAAAKCLADGLVDAGISVPGVVTEKSSAEVFAEAYCGASKMTHSITFSQRIYELQAVSPEVPKIGHFRAAHENDLSFFPYWSMDFAAAAGIASPENAISSDIEQYRYHITSGKLYILEDSGLAVSMSKIARQSENVAGIGYVYTPPYLRGKGYASSITAQISQFCLDNGSKSCVLYTDLANPTSNSIYQKIGYVPICDSLEIKFGSGQK